MEIASSSTQSAATLPVQPLETPKDSGKKEAAVDQSGQTGGGDDFSVFMKKALGGDGKSEVNEEELFAALIEQRLEKLKPEAAESFRKHKAALLPGMTKPDGYVPMEDLAKAALKACAEEGVIERTQADQVNGEAFAGAQLDTNKDALYDGRGGAGDDTIATAATASALMTMKDLVTKIESGELKIDPRSLDIPSNGKPAGSSSADGGIANITPGNSSMVGEQHLDGSGGFLWKPESDSDGNLVVLLPSELNGLIDSVEVHEGMPFSNETKVEEGRYASIGNGDRQHYRFKKSGGDYGDDVYVVANRSNGETIFWKIDTPSERQD